MNTFTYNSTASSAYGIFIEHRPVVTFPQRIVESIAIPGRSGNLLYDTGAYANVTVTYQVAYRDPGNVRSNAINIATWLYQGDYCDLTDDYDPLYYRKGIFVSPLGVADVLNVAGRANITFECKPQRFLLSGKTAITATTSTTLTNNYQDALPVITVSGSGNGTLTVGGTTVTITAQTASIVLDSERQTAESGGNNANSQISLSNGFPVLKNGSTSVSWTGGVTGVSIVPNYWTL